MQMTRDVLDDEMMLKAAGNQEVWVENYRTLFLYTAEQICLAGKKSSLCIEGAHMRIEYYGSEDMKITGEIHTIHFDKKQ